MNVELDANHLPLFWTLRKLPIFRGKSLPPPLDFRNDIVPLILDK